MNNLIVINLLKSFLLYSPFILVLLKDIVICILEGVQSHREKVFEKYKNQLFKQHNVHDKHDLPKEVFDEYYKNYNFVHYESKLQKTLSFMQDNLCLDSYNGIYEFYLGVSAILLLIGVISTIWIVDDYNDQKKLYKTNYQVIRQYEDGNYKNLPNWKYDAKSVCEKAESTNDKFFTKNGSPNPGWFKYIDSKNYDGLKPIDTNVMWTDFFEMCENKKELLK